jgi:hypothetical protein
VESNLQKNRVYSIQANVKTQLRSGAVSLIIENEFQHYFVNVLPSTKISSRLSRYALTGQGEYQFSKRLFITGRILSVFIFPNNQKTQNLSQLESRISYHTKNKRWQFDITGNNLLGQRKFSTTSIYPTFIQESTFDLFPRAVLCGIKLKF